METKDKKKNTFVQTAQTIKDELFLLLRAVCVSTEIIIVHRFKPEGKLKIACRESNHLFSETKMENENFSEIERLIENGSIVVCPVCEGLSAHAWGDTTSYDQFVDGIIPGGFVPAKGTIAHIGTSSCWEWECGHCKSHVVEAGSPLTDPCYTHEED
jgi:hypothetical protein